VRRSPAAKKQSRNSQLWNRSAYLRDNLRHKIATIERARATVWADASFYRSSAMKSS